MWKGPIIDAHSQVDRNTDIEKVVPLMDKAGVSMTLLSTRFSRDSKDVVTYAERHPERIVPSVKTKTKQYMKGRGSFPKIFLDELGKTANTGKMGRKVRRDALHFAVFYSKYPEWSNDGVVVTPKDGYFMDPNAFYRLASPYESRSLATLPSNQKRVPIPYMKADGILVPSDTKRIWPYVCK